MMYIQIIHASGEVYELPVSQVSVHAADGQPCAIAYERSGLIIYTDVTKDDFDTSMARLKIKKLDVDG